MFFILLFYINSETFICPGVDSVIVVPSSIDSIQDLGECKKTCVSLSFEANSQLNVIGPYAFYESKLLSSVDFSNCLNLFILDEFIFLLVPIKTINFPPSLKYIDQGCFIRSRLESANLSVAENLLEIRTGAFSRCSFLESVDLTNCFNLELIEERIFSQSEIKEIKFPTKCNLKILPSTCLSEIRAPIIIPNYIEVIGDRAFQFSRFVSFSFENNSKCIEIGTFAFGACNFGNSTVFEIPQSVLTIGLNPWALSTVESFEVDSRSSTFVTINKMLFSKDKRYLYSIPMSYMGPFLGPSQLENITVSFYNSIIKEIDLSCTKITGFPYVPESLGELRLTPFGGAKFTVLKLPPKLELIESPFISSSNIVELVIPDSVQQIDGAAFYNCKNLTFLKLPKDLTVIPGMLCYGCSNLVYLVLPDNYQSIGGSSFFGCSKICGIKATLEQQSLFNVSKINYSVFTKTCQIPPYELECFLRTKKFSNSWKISSAMLNVFFQILPLLALPSF